MDWRYIHQCKQAQIYKIFIHGNTTKPNKNYIVGDIVMTRNRSSYKYKTTILSLTKGIVFLQMEAVTMRINIRHIKPYDNIDAE